MGYNTIHETEISDIVSVIKGGIEHAKEKSSKISNLRYSSSIAKQAKGLIMEFPVLVSKANHIESAGIIAKAYEAKFVTMLQLVFSSAQLTNSSEAKNGMEFLQRFHNNLDQKTFSVDDLINTMDNYVQHNSAVMSADSYAQCKAVMEDMKNLSYYFIDDISESSLDSYKVLNNYSGVKVVREDNVNPNIPRNLIDDDINAQVQKDKVRRDRIKNGDDEELKLKQKKDKRDEEDLDIKKNRDQRDEIKSTRDTLTNYLVSSDIKKANELAPTLMIVNFIYKDENGESIPQQFIAGVKAKLYEVEPNDVIDKIITKYSDNNMLLKFIKASTRQISFAKDFLLAIDDAKLYALSRSKKGSTNRLFKVLERRALGGKIRKSLKLKDYTQAISSLVISQEEAEELLKNNIDVSNPSVIRPIMEKLNLISFAIIDESSESVKFIFDTGDDIYETIPLSKLEREQKDGMSKKVINLMAKMNR